MIRDEFIKQQNEKKLSTKEMQKIRQFGERSFYTKEINRITSYSKPLTFSFIILSVLLVIVAAPLVLILIGGGKLTSENLFPIISVVLMALMLIGWFCVFLPLGKKKVKRYKKALEELREKDGQRQKIIFKDYIK